MPFSEESKDNLNKMNISDKKIFLVGNPGLEILKNFKPVIKKELIQKKYNLNEKYILCVFHPETKNGTEYIKTFFDNLLLFLNKNHNLSIVILKTNCDPGYLKILNQIEETIQHKNNKKSDNIN